MAKKKRKRTARKSASDESYPSWVWGVFGLAVGLSVAAAVWVSDRDRLPAAPGVAEAPKPEPEPAVRPAEAEQNYDNNGEFVDAEQDARASRFDFYTLLPQAEVLVTDVDPDIATDTQPAAVVKPGRYVLQAGSFSAYEDADRRRAELALHGIESRIQRVAIDDSTYHRVRIGPISDLDELNMLRSRLRSANIDVLRIRFDE